MCVKNINEHNVHKPYKRSFSDFLNYVIECSESAKEAHDFFYKFDFILPKNKSLNYEFISENRL